MSGCNEGGGGFVGGRGGGGYYVGLGCLIFPRGIGDIT